MKKLYDFRFKKTETKGVSNDFANIQNILQTFALLIGNLPIGKIRYTLSITSLFIATLLIIFILLSLTEMPPEGICILSVIASIITVTIYGYIIHDKYKPVNAEYYAFDYLNENKLETEIIEDSYIHSSTSKNRKLNSNKN